jgi:hypothetical protein
MNTFTRSILKTACISLAVSASIISASAANVHFKQNRAPTFFDQGTYLEAVGALVGLGNSDVTINLSARGQVTATCTNPGTGEHRPPGQNPADVTLTGTQVIPETEIKNGTTNFDVATSTPESPVAGAPGCPSSKWVETIIDVSFTSATLTVIQSDSTVFTASCKFRPPTSDGQVPSNNVKC